MVSSRGGQEPYATVLMRLPCRTSTDDRYFGDEWQALPARGYTRIFENMMLGDDNITIRLNCDFFAHKAAGTLPKHKLLVYTGGGVCPLVHCPLGCRSARLPFYSFKNSTKARLSTVRVA